MPVPRRRLSIAPLPSVAKLAGVTKSSGWSNVTGLPMQLASVSARNTSSGVRLMRIRPSGPGSTGTSPGPYNISPVRATGTSSHSRKPSGVSERFGPSFCTV
ncbi:hypothetical protein D3C87_1769730 [compost metagenome]